jgi:hypothetical protein
MRARTAYPSITSKIRSASGVVSNGPTMPAGTHFATAAGSSCPSTKCESMPSTTRAARSRAAASECARTIRTHRVSPVRYASQNKGVTPPSGCPTCIARCTHAPTVRVGHTRQVRATGSCKGSSVYATVDCQRSPRDTRRANNGQREPRSASLSCAVLIAHAPEP